MASNSAIVARVLARFTGRVAASTARLLADMKKEREKLLHHYERMNGYWAFIAKRHFGWDAKHHGNDVVDVTSPDGKRFVTNGLEDPAPKLSEWLVKETSFLRDMDAKIRGYQEEIYKARQERVKGKQPDEAAHLPNLGIPLEKITFSPSQGERHEGTETFLINFEILYPTGGVLGYRVWITEPRTTSPDERRTSTNRWYDMDSAKWMVSGGLRRNDRSTIGFPSSTRYFDTRAECVAHAKKIMSDAYERLLKKARDGWPGHGSRRRRVRVTT